MEQLRRVLVERYVGLVMVCAFLVQALVFAALILQYPFENLVIGIYNLRRPIDSRILHSTYYTPWPMTIWQLASLTINLLIAFVLYRWLYPSRKADLPRADSARHEES